MSANLYRQHEVWVCGKCSEKNQPSDTHCKNCGEVTIKGSRPTVSKKPVFRCPQCNGKKISPRVPCPCCSEKKKQVARISPIQMPPQDGIESEELRIVLLGKTGAGKSATANTFLNSPNLFRSMSSLKSVTTKCQYKRKERGGRNILIVDTPGLFDTSMPKEVIATEIKKSVAISAPGPHAFLLVISLSNRFTPEEMDVIKELDEIFGANMTKYLIVVFTKRDQIECDSFEDYIKECPQQLKQLLKEAGGGYITFNNRGDDKEKENDSQRMFDSTLEMLKLNGGEHFTSEMFREAEALMKDRIENELKRKEQELRREIEKELRKEMEETMTKERDYFQRLHEESVERIEKMKLDLQAERDTTDGKESEKVLGELVYKEMEKNEQKDKLIQLIQRSEGAERERMEHQLDDVGAKIKQIIAKRKTVEEEVAGEKMSTAIVLKSRALREEERHKVEEEDYKTMSRLQEGISNLGTRFLSLFQ